MKRDEVKMKQNKVMLISNNHERKRNDMCRFVIMWEVCFKEFCFNAGSCFRTLTKY